MKFSLQNYYIITFLTLNRLCQSPEKNWAKINPKPGTILFSSTSGLQISQALVPLCWSSANTLIYTEVQKRQWRTPKINKLSLLKEKATEEHHAVITINILTIVTATISDAVTAKMCRHTQMVHHLSYQTTPKTENSVTCITTILQLDPKFNRSSFMKHLK